MLSICMPYRQAPGEVVAHETDLVHAIRRASGEKNFITWKGPSGEWVVSYVFPDGSMVDTGFAGKGERPEVRRGMVDSMANLIKARGMNKGLIAEAQRALESKQRAHTNKLIDQNREQLDYRKHLRRGATQHWWDHPMLNPGR